MTQLAVIESLSAPIVTDTDGVCRVAGTRVRLETILNAYALGFSAEDIAGKYPAISLSDAYAIIAWYLQNRETGDVYLAERNTEIERSDREIEERTPAAEIRARLQARRKSAAS